MEKLERPENPPSTEDLSFVKSFEIKEIQDILFEDKLTAISGADLEVGEFLLSMTEAKHSGVDCIRVHAVSSGIVDNVPCGTAITAFVSHQLETLEEEHHEFVKPEDYPLDRRARIVREEDGYSIQLNVVQGEKVENSSHKYSFEEMKGVFPEGSNLVLLRLLIRRGFPLDKLQLLTLDSNMKLCPIVYRSLGKQTELVEQTELETHGIEKTVFTSQEEEPAIWQSYFTTNGHLVRRFQVGSSMVMKLMSSEDLHDDDYDPKPTFEKKPLVIDEDMELNSKYLDRKEEVKANHAKYLRDNPDVQNLIADYLQFLLLRKPDDIISFSADYFSTFSSKKIH